MSKSLVIGVLLLLSVACGGAAAPTLAPPATPSPTLTPTTEPSATSPPTPAPTATPLATPTSTPQPTVIPTVEVASEPPLPAGEHDTGILVAVFPEISEKMKDIRPVYTAYYHSEDWHAPGKNTTVDEVFKLLKMENIATHEGHQQVSPAMVVDLEPDLIIADSIESVVENPALAGLHMVQDTLHIPHHIFVLREGYSFYVAARDSGTPFWHSPPSPTPIPSPLMKKRWMTTAKVRKKRVRKREAMTTATDTRTDTRANPTPSKTPKHRV